MAKKQCGYCVYMDISKFKDGKFFCEKDQIFKFANSSEAENCIRYCQRFRKDMPKGEAAIKTSNDYLAANKEYTSVGCYITTVVVHILGMNDDNVVLQILRNFRSEFLQKKPEYNELLLKYDAVGPLIARSIAHDTNAYEVALDLYKVYIQGAYDYIRRGHRQKALILYKEMTENLMKHYQISYFIPDGMENKIDEHESGHGRLVLKPIDKK